MLLRISVLSEKLGFLLLTQTGGNHALFKDLGGNAVHCYVFQSISIIIFVYYLRNMRGCLRFSWRKGYRCLLIQTGSNHVFIKYNLLRFNLGQNVSTLLPYYSINRPGRLFNFGPMRVSAYSRVGAYYFPNIFSKQGHFRE